MGRVIHVSWDSNTNPDFYSLGEALSSIQKDNHEEITIHLHEGVYKEKVVIDQPYITLIGDGPDKTIIT